MLSERNPKIVYADQTLLVVDKPAELLSVPGRGPEKQDCLINRLLPEYPNARIVHRLDMSTSGLLIIPLSYGAERHISKQFQARTVTKQYAAVVFGHLLPEQGLVDLPLICDWPNRPKQKVDLQNGKSSQTEYVVSEHFMINDQPVSRIVLNPITGRSHQLRVHMQALGHAILGDNLYAEDAALTLSTRLLLHAQRIKFEHPDSGAQLEIHSPAPF